MRFYRQQLQLFNVIHYHVSFDLSVRFFNEREYKSKQEGAEEVVTVRRHHLLCSAANHLTVQTNGKLTRKRQRNYSPLMGR